ncbi:LamG-like jellyroll fold domain-containing protein [Catenovulum agarivorans]|uniref:LamG-like jellyroll fold domain-containing protein n=1 Tax=Catenovulum agarivorans TaxID=1172192 RepID=UPI0002F35237|nr:LamG-like jellyroll fold domain-containing protein [Catenovulum agarivorans]
MNYSDEFKAVREIADAVCEEQVTPEQIQQLEQLIKDNPKAMRFYLDYVGIHTYLSSGASQNLEYVYRRISTAEEFIVRAHNNTSVLSIGNEIDSSKDTCLGDASDLPKVKLWNKIKLVLFAVILCAFVAVAVATWVVLKDRLDPFKAEVIEGQFSIVNLGQISENYLYIGEYKANQEAQLKLASGEIIKFTKNSLFKLVNPHEIKLIRGTVSVVGANNHNLVVHGTKFSLNTNGGDLLLDLTKHYPQIVTGEKTTLIPQRWRPTHYWSFDGNVDRVIDTAGTAHGIAASGALRTEGLLGKGAYYFDNSVNARVDVGSGGGTVPASGSFAVNEGITLEALVKPEFSASVGDMDEIFRKDQEDKELRIVLSFQNDIQYKPYLRPDGDFKESLSFGLYLVGQGYHELKLPLDGLEGRPTLADLKDGRAHHIVATYSVKTGLKAIYIDGVQHASYQYPPGSKMLSGGAGAANIGNSPNRPVPVRSTDVRFANNEAFAGTIDEVAFYDFALTPFMVELHFNNLGQHLNYFGLQPSIDLLPERTLINLPTNYIVELDPTTGLPW